MSRWWAVILIPQLLHAQSNCTDSPIVRVTDRRGWFVDKTAFEQQLLSQARIKLIQETLGSNVQQTFHVYQEGSRTVYKTTQSSTYQVVQATLTNECHNITYDGRTATVVLSASLIPRNDVPLTPPQFSRPYTSVPVKTSTTTTTKVTWGLGYILLYIYSSR